MAIERQPVSGAQRATPREVALFGEQAPEKKLLPANNRAFVTLRGPADYLHIRKEGVQGSFLVTIGVIEPHYTQKSMGKSLHDTGGKGGAYGVRIVGREKPAHFVVKPAIPNQNIEIVILSSNKPGELSRKVQLVVHTAAAGHRRKPVMVERKRFEELGFNLDPDDQENNGHILDYDLSQLFFDFQLAQGEFGPNENKDVA